MRIIAKSTLKKFWSKPGCHDAEGPLRAWAEEVALSNWSTPQELKQHFGRASICGNNRVVFDIGGNKYRLVVEIQYLAKIVWIKFIGTHKQYDEIDVESVNEY
jgi:mRNA interferase HigB